LKARIGDLSYGLYLFGFPVLGSIVALSHQTLSAETVFGIALPVTLVFAILSWHLVENPALRLRHKVRLRESSRNDLATLTKQDLPSTSQQC